jgi:hypothetical protein
MFTEVPEKIMSKVIRKIDRFWMYQGAQAATRLGVSDVG